LNYLNKPNTTPMEENSDTYSDLVTSESAFYDLDGILTDLEKLCLDLYPGWRPSRANKGEWKSWAQLITE
jgi:hypothetical protein